MNLLKTPRSKKGISPILATLLLIVIAVAAIVVTYAWVMTFMGSQTSSAGVLLAVENVSWNSTASTIAVKNIGTSDAKIVRLYIGITAQNLIDVTANTNIVTGKQLLVDQTAIVVLDWPNNLGSSWTSGTMYYFKIAPETGSTLEFTKRAP